MDPRSAFEEVVVQDGYIFLLGDNRDNSSDSRAWGQVPIDSVVGVVLAVVWPPAAVRLVE